MGAGLTPYAGSENQDFQVKKGDTNMFQNIGEMGDRTQ